MNVNGIGTTGYPAWQGARKNTAEYCKKEFCRTDKQCGRCKATYIYCLYENG